MLVLSTFSTFLLRVGSSQGAATLVLASPMKGRKGLDHKVLDAYATRADFVHNIT